MSIEQLTESVRSVLHTLYVSYVPFDSACVSCVGSFVVQRALSDMVGDERGVVNLVWCPNNGPGCVAQSQRSVSLRK